MDFSWIFRVFSIFSHKQPVFLVADNLHVKALKNSWRIELIQRAAVWMMYHVLLTSVAMFDCEKVARRNDRI